MLDTLGIRIPDEFIVRKGTDLSLYHASVNMKDGEVKNDFYLFDLNGKEITGSKAILNRENYQVTIDSRGLYIQLSVPKYARGNNYRLSDATETALVMSDLQGSLDDEGIKLNVLDAIPARLDGCKNVSLDHPTGNYLSFIGSLGGSRMNHKSSYNDGMTRTGYQWTNTRQEVICYDKRLEMQFRKAHLTGLPKNILRFEHRLRNGQKIKDALGFYSVRDMIKSFGEIGKNYNKVLSKTVFKYGVDDKRLFSSSTIEDYLQYALVNYKRSKFQRFIIDIVVSKENLLIDQQSLFEALEVVMRKEKYTSSTKRKFRYNLKQLFSNRIEIGAGIDQVNVRELYGELKGKLLRIAS